MTSTISSSRTSTPPGSPDHDNDSDALLHQFLAERDVPCPRCGYNLRQSPQPRCPECNIAITLQVGRPFIPIGWFVLTLAPSIFSGICALLLLLPVFLIMSYAPNDPDKWLIIGIETFGLFSAGVGVMLWIYHRRLLAMPVSTQRMWVALTWTIHIIAFCASLGIASML